MRAGTVVFYLLLVILLTMASVQYGLGRLPGDIVVDLGDFYFYLPFTTAIIVAVLLGVVFWLFRR
ncbi:hypothetical protein AUC71_10325 [Methyloceanibacter marginalis]|jgi:heme/copper-type cytochrome/quinol oxidase subunit 2|uniref:DUF2905 domain-containing protein n=1 Tax=Methyloceanibacter marginalis TaxID=1774971 RepID=A0A1E3WCQ1_9HYPH|nr:DUF2905 domain-containing protein [Methyloceanibacter marginalis]ODS03302.1 hypothetical protein AUC71_10325 [Methyloceanibacter marginalis]